MNESQNHKIEFFVISRKRLFLLSFLTFGVYQFYWFYKNWSAVKKAENSNIFPFARAFFCIFYCYSLFKKISESAKSRGYNGFRLPGLLAIGYFVINVTGALLLYSKIAYIITLIASIGIVCIVQKAINFNSDLRKKLSRGEILVVLATFAFLCLHLYNNFTESLITRTVRGMKEHYALPHKLSSEITLIDISENLSEKSIRYHCALTNVDTNDITKEYLKNSLTPYVCKGFKFLLDKKINIEFSFIAENVANEYLVSFSKKDCAATSSR